MAFWWVNQGQSWRDEVPGEYLWSQKRDARGRQLQYYDNMTLLEPGDIVFSHFEGAMRYVGVVVTKAVSSPQPDFIAAGAPWSEEGWFAQMRYLELSPPLEPQRFLDLYNEVAPVKYAPMTTEGRVNQQYLFAIPSALGTHFLAAVGLQEEAVRDAARYDPSVDDDARDASAILADPDLTPFDRHTLARARVGQGLYKERVRRVEPTCRLTGLSNPAFLVARPLKPWRDAVGAERLDGHNGLLLSPHAGFLLDRGLVTFEDSGRVVASPHLPSAVVRWWELDLSRKGKRFRREQLPYLEHHRKHVFRAEWTPRLEDIGRAPVPTSSE